MPIALFVTAAFIIVCLLIVIYYTTTNSGKLDAATDVLEDAKVQVEIADVLKRAEELRKGIEDDT